MPSYSTTNLVDEAKKNVDSYLEPGFCLNKSSFISYLTTFDRDFIQYSKDKDIKKV